MKTKQLYAHWDFAPAWAKWHTVDMHGRTWWQKRPKWNGWHWETLLTAREIERDTIADNNRSVLYDDRGIDDRKEASKTLEGLGA